MIAMAQTMPDVLVFASATAMILVGALGVIRYKNPVHSALSLILTFLGMALAFIEQQANFLAAVQIIVYAGAIVVLFLFVIMFLGVDRAADDTEPLVGQRPLAALSVAVTVAGLITMLARSHWYSGATAATTGQPLTGSDVATLGRSVFTSYLFAFEITGALLVIAVVGAVVLARRDRPVEQGGEA
jgi:NADH-quinone oxidoreductase subunit J